VLEERRIDQHVSPARVRLSAATRALVEAVVETRGLADDDLDRSTAAIEAITADLRARIGGPNEDDGAREFGVYLERNRLIGLAHPMSPAGDYTFADGVLEVRVAFGDAYEGPQGFVHGGFIALAFDELLSLAAAFAGEGGVTGTLTTRYRKPTPLRQELRLTGWVEHREGRRMRARGTIHDGDTLTAEAEGLFISARRDGTGPLAST
jgi:acyl-coenzyme A thioesterase PaaI-like protein